MHYWKRTYFKMFNPGLLWWVNGTESASAGDSGLLPGPGRSHRPGGNKARASRPLSLLERPAPWSPGATPPKPKRHGAHASQREKPQQGEAATREQPLLAAN